MITVPEAARQAGKNAETIRRWIRTGRLRSERIGTQHLVDIDDVLAIADEGALDLPAAWRVADDGVMPVWERLVRDARSSH